MKLFQNFSCCSLAACLVFFFVQTNQAQNESEKFGAVSCEREMAILDNIEFKLKSSPFTTAYFLFTGESVIPSAMRCSYEARGCEDI